VNTTAGGASAASERPLQGGSTPPERGDSTRLHSLCLHQNAQPAQFGGRTGGSVLAWPCPDPSEQTGGARAGLAYLSRTSTLPPSGLDPNPIAVFALLALDVINEVVPAALSISELPQPCAPPPWLPLGSRIYRQFDMAIVGPGCTARHSLSCSPPFHTAVGRVLASTPNPSTLHPGPAGGPRFAGPHRLPAGLTKRAVPFGTAPWPCRRRARSQRPSLAGYAVCERTCSGLASYVIGDLGVDRAREDRLQKSFQTASSSTGASETDDRISFQLRRPLSRSARPLNVHPVISASHWATTTSCSCHQTFSQP
jgi:hypothetical protein